uniref:Uncharacterized protein n=1 Tax=Anguilla anguilla TaxID=7936 RepID=A0A0E9THR3_ANGAN
MSVQLPINSNSCILLNICEFLHQKDFLHNIKHCS